MTTQIIPLPKVPLAFRVATMSDLPFIDALHKQHGKGLGYWTTKQFEGYIAGSHVLVAEADTGYSILDTWVRPYPPSSQYPVSSIPRSV